MKRILARGLALLAALALTACAAQPRLAPPAGTPERRELAEVPFFPQEDYQCGPAALASVLAHDGAAVTPAMLAPQVFLPDRRGSLQLELIAAVRRHGRVPYLLPPSLSALLTEVAAGRPVLVLQNLGFRAWPIWHYAVVIGFDAARDTLLLRSGGEARHALSARRFMTSWSRAGHWALVVSRPEAPPASAEPRRWLAAAAAFEQLGQWPQAQAAYAAATQRWPREPLAWLALANAAHARGESALALEAARRGVALAPSAAAYNNLAQLLLQRGCPAAAGEALRAGRALPQPAAIAEALAHTGAELAAFEGPDRCAMPLAASGQ